MSPFPVRMEDHWSLQPGVDPARARIMWLILFEDHPQVAELARVAHTRLSGLACLDLVPEEWLHMTTLIAGFADDIAPGQINIMISEARRILAHTSAITIKLGRVLYHPRAVMLDAGPAHDLEPVLNAARAATSIATGWDGELYHKPWVPHITLAYSNSVHPAAPVIEALGRQLPRREVRIRSISLVSQTHEQMWTWHPIATLPFGRAR